MFDSLLPILILYLWFLSGLYSVNKLKSPHVEGRILFIAYFMGPFGLLYAYYLQNQDSFGNFLKFKSGKKPPEKPEYLDLVFLDSQGRDRFSGRAENTDAVNFVKKMIYDAAARRSSDVFIDPKNDEYVIRFRADGLIQPYETLREEKALAVVGMIKIASGMDIAEKRCPQDGSFTAVCNGTGTSFRVASVGVFGGEKITIRVIASENGKRDLAQIGFQAEQLAIVRSGIKLPSGMILICGPAGSGKTSTLYAMLDAIDYSARNVISIEDPVERVIPQISQMEVNARADITFASLLRNALRQNPDVICVGEIRDEETAQVAFQAAQTGHLIISTLQSNDNIGAIVRLTELGVPLRSIAACLHLVISQRLVRKLCPDCREKAQLTGQQLSSCQAYDIPPDRLYSAPGCPHCDHTGFSGCQAVFEFLTMTNGLRAVMEDPGASVSAVKEYLELNQAGSTIFSITGDMLLNGEIPLDEFERVNINF